MAWLLSLSNRFPTTGYRLWTMVYGLLKLFETQTKHQRMQKQFTYGHGKGLILRYKDVAERIG
jgi:hypothetical protein